MPSGGRRGKLRRPPRASPGTSTTMSSPSMKKWWCSVGLVSKIGLAPVDRELAQQPDLGELVQGVVDGGERDRDAGPRRLLEQHLGRDVPVALAEQEPAERDALARRPQAHAPQLVPQVRERAAAQGDGPERRGGVGRRPAGRVAGRLRSDRSGSSRGCSDSIVRSRAGLPQLRSARPGDPGFDGPNRRASPERPEAAGRLLRRFRGRTHGRPCPR